MIRPSDNIAAPRCDVGNRNRFAQRGQWGFTLTEILVVVVILLFLVTTIAVVVGRSKDIAHGKATRLLLSNLAAVAGPPSPAYPLPAPPA